jgi:hypothetical protein
MERMQCRFDTPIDQPNTVAPAPVSKESVAVILAGKEIDRTFSLFKDGEFKEVIRISETVHTDAINMRNESDIKIIKDILFEAALEFSLAGNVEIALKILAIAYSPSSPKKFGNFGKNDHHLAHTCWGALLSSKPSFWSQNMVYALEKTIPEEEHLKCAPYFLAKIFHEGLYGEKQDEVKAKEYFDIAKNRGYEPRKLNPI